MGRNIVETIVGGLVLVIAAGFLIKIMGTADVGAGQGGYEIEARFLRAGGLQSGAPVRVSGIRVGTVAEHALDPDMFEAVMTLSIHEGIQLPEDTEAVISNDGLLGGKYLRLLPGQADTYLSDGDTLTNTKDFESIEDTVARIIFLATN